MTSKPRLTLRDFLFRFGHFEERGREAEGVHGAGSGVADRNVTSFRHVYCGMAFPIPSHLPKKQATDVSSAILGRISDTDSRSLNAALTETWITDLDESIRAAKVSPCLGLRIQPFDHSPRSQQLIHERIQNDLPSFSSQFAAAESIRSRLHSLRDNTDSLSNAISNPEVRSHSLSRRRWH